MSSLVGSFDGTGADAAAGRFLAFIDGDDGGEDLFVRIFFSATDFSVIDFVSCTIEEDDGNSCFTVGGLTSMSDTNPK